jgi:hypothetical protein
VKSLSLVLILALMMSALPVTAQEQSQDPQTQALSADHSAWLRVLSL